MSDADTEETEEVEVELSERHQKFADCYLATGNVTQSYLEAGYEVADSVAATNGYRLRRNAKVAAYIEQEQSKLAERAQITRETLVDDWVEVWATPVGMIDEDHHLAQEVTKRYDKDGKHISTTIKMPPKSEALKEIAKLTGAYEPEKHDHTSSDGSMTPQVIERRVVDPKEEG